MTYKIEMISIKDNKVAHQESSKINNPKKDSAIIIHLFYIDIWEELKTYLSQLKIEFDLFITVTDNIADEDILQIFRDQPAAHIYSVENRGRDVLPFLQVMNLLDTKSYKHICKLHTKKTGDSDLGNVWRKLLYFDLIGSDKNIKRVLKLLDNYYEVGMVTGKNAVLSSSEYDFGNADRVRELAQMAGIEYQDEYSFPAGTMFWTKPELLDPLLRLLNGGDLKFDKERGQTEKTLAHAIERFFGLLCRERGKQIEESPTHYSKLDDATLDQMASLVLTQKYIDYDEYLRMQDRIKEQDQWLEEQDKWIKQQDKSIKQQEQWIKELEDLAQSLRIKNRIKRLYPKSTIGSVQAAIRNPALLKKVLHYAKRGEFSYIWNKMQSKKQKNISKGSSFVQIDPENIFKPFSPDDFPIGDHIIDIIIPVYNGYEFLTPLFDSIEKNTTSPHRLIVINDCSPDERVKPLLVERLKKHPGSIFIDHEANLGFVKSVTEAYSHTSDHFLILNTDTELPSYWLERLMHPILNMDKIASTTPFTNSGQIASFPNFIADNDIFEGMRVDELDSIFKMVNPDNFYTQIPTGVGFCMGVNYDLIQEIGFFVEEEFGRGYGEENDWCQRAIQHGYSNLLVPNLFVYHKHGGSFSAEDKQRLMKENAIKLLHRHPNYDKDVESYVKKDPHKVLREILVIAASSQDKEALHLIIDHALGGGANHYTEELLEKYLQKDKKVLRLEYDFYSHKYIIYFDYKTYHYSYVLGDFEKVKSFFSHLKFAEVFVNNLVSFQDPIPLLQWIVQLANQDHCKLVVPIHDYYPICPNYTLLDPQGVFCEIPDSLQTCQKCMQKNDLEWRTFVSNRIDMNIWRREWEKLLMQCDSIICFSNSSRKLLLRAYGELDEKKIMITPHQVAPLPPVESAEKKNKPYLTVGILGGINQAKGADIIDELVKTIDAKNLPMKVILIGEISKNISSKSFMVTGEYKRDELPQLVTRHEIDIFLLPSVCPETFSYTTQEVMMMGMPLMVFDIGAPAERVKEYDKGVVLGKEYCKNVIKYLEKFQG